LQQRWQIERSAKYQVAYPVEEEEDGKWQREVLEQIEAPGRPAWEPPGTSTRRRAAAGTTAEHEHTHTDASLQVDKGCDDNERKNSNLQWPETSQ